MDEIKIVKLPPEEWLKFKQIRLEALQMDADAFGSSYEKNVTKPDSFWQNILEVSMDEQRMWSLFVQDGDEVVGLLGALENAEAGVAGIVCVYLRKEYRGRGIAQQMMTELLAAVTRSGKFHTLRLTANKHRTPAVTLYENFGFKVVAEEYVQLGDGNYYGEYVMEKSLTASP